MLPHISRMKALGLSARRFAAITHTNPVTVSYWGRVRDDDRRKGDIKPVPVPYWVDLLLDAYERYPDLIPTEDDQRAQKKLSR